MGTKSDFDNIKHLLEWFTGTHETLRHFELLLNNKWQIVKLLYSYKKLDSSKKAEYFSQMTEIDWSDTMKSNQVFCQAMISDVEGMKKLWDSFFDETISDSINIMAMRMDGFKWSPHYAEIEKYNTLFFEKVLEVFKTRSREYARIFYTHLFPGGDKIKEHCEKVEKLITQVPLGEDSLLKILKESHDNLERRMKCIECLLKYMETKN